jgi:hypothetical protein
VRPVDEHLLELQQLRARCVRAGKSPRGGVDRISYLGGTVPDDIEPRANGMAMTSVEATPSHDDGSASPDSQSSSQAISSTPRWPYFVLLTLALIAAIVAAIVYHAHPSANTREMELLKACFSVLVVAVVGGLATFAFGRLQKERDRRQEDARRDMERRIDERRRRDEQVTAVLNETLEHWLAVKRIRRELEAATWTGSSASITLEDYDCYLRELNQHQLAFERLMKIVPLLDERIPHVSKQLLTTKGSDSLEKLFHAIEDFLNDVVDEYQRSRHLVAKRKRLDLADLAAHSNALPARIRCQPGRDKPERRRTLYEFIYETGIFREESADDVKLVIRRLEQAILEPLDLSLTPKAKREKTGER